MVSQNISSSKHRQCKTGSLKILKEIVVHPDIRKAITQMGGIELMVIIFTFNQIIMLTFPPSSTTSSSLADRDKNVKIIINIFKMIIMIMISIKMTKVRILADSNKHLKLHAAESLSKLAKYKKVFAQHFD